MPRRIFASICLLTFLTTACHTYRFAEPGEAVAGADVRLRVTPEEAGRLMETGGPVTCSASDGQGGVGPQIAGSVGEIEELVDTMMLVGRPGGRCRLCPGDDVASQR